MRRLSRHGFAIFAAVAFAPSAFAASTVVVSNPAATTLVVPSDYVSAGSVLHCLGAGGSSVNGSTTAAGASGGSGEYGTLSGPTLTAGSTITVVMAAAGSGTTVQVKDNSNAVILDCASGGNASGLTAGAAGTGGTHGTHTAGTIGAVGTSGGKKSGGGGSGAPGPLGSGSKGGVSGSGTNQGGPGGGGANNGAGVPTTPSSADGTNGTAGGFASSSGGVAPTGSGGNGVPGGNGALGGGGGGARGRTTASPDVGGNGVADNTWGTGIGPSGGGAGGAGSNFAGGHGGNGGNASYGASGGGGGADDGAGATASLAGTSGGSLIVLTCSACGATQTMAIDELVANRIYQRKSNATKNADIAFSGTYTVTAPTAIDIKLDYVAGGSALGYTACGSVSASAGVWTCTLANVPAGAWYLATAKDHTTGTVSNQQSNQWGVGILIVVAGSSTPAQMWSVATGGITADAYTMRWGGGGWFSTVSGSQNANDVGSVVGGLAEFGNRIRAALVAANGSDVTPVGLLQCAIGGSQIPEWISGGARYAQCFSSTLQTSGGVTNAAVGGDFEIFMFMNGNDNKTSDNPAAYYATDLTQLDTDLRALTGRNSSTLQVGLGGQHSIIGTDMSCSGIYDGPKMDIVNAAMWAHVQTAGHFYIGSHVDLLHSGDCLHVSTAGHLTVVRRWAQGVAYNLGLSATPTIGPQITSATRASGSAVVKLFITQSSGGTALLDGAGGGSGTGLGGFVVTVNGSPATISSTAIVSATEIDLTLSSAPADSDTVQYEYGADLNPFGQPNTGGNQNNVVYDNNSTLLTDTWGFMLKPTWGQQSVPAPSSGARPTMLFNVGEIIPRDVPARIALSSIADDIPRQAWAQ